MSVQTAPKAFGIPLSQVIANDRAFKQRQDALKESRRDCLDLEASVLRFRAQKQQLLNGNKAGQPAPGSSTSTISSSLLSVAPQLTSCSASAAFELLTKPLSPTFRDCTARVQRRGGLSVDCISDLVESQSRLLEALQLSHPAELELKKISEGAEPGGRTQTKLSLNPIYRQVPRVLERCCSHIEAFGLQTVGIFRVGSSKKRVRQLREDFDMGTDVVLDEEQSVHDIAALLKEFLRDMPDPLLPRELYPAFLHASLLRGPDQLLYVQQLMYLLPPCNSDTLLRLLALLHTVQGHAQDSLGPHDQEIPGNKMTAANLAVIFGPNLLQGERGTGGERGAGGDPGPLGMGIEDSNAIISVTLLLIQNYRKLFTVSAELQQEVLMSLIQTDPDIIDYLLRRKLSGCHLTVDSSDPPGAGRRDTDASLDSVGVSSGSLSPLEPPSPLFPPDGPDGGSLTGQVFLNMLRLNTGRKRSSEAQRKSIGQIRQFHSHHNLLSLASSSSFPLPTSRTGAHPEDRDAQERRGPLGEALSFALGASSCSSLGAAGEGSVWVRQGAHQEEGGSKTSTPTTSNFWDFFTGKASGSETMV
ncbi:rho GTPase-activating protein 36 [Osmerus eperlanus]|uniref:rho GTPase-activating protein 36 n=1 Tax=Osmerus eperlanus TaxID=29151 RepID=UPI002E104977